MDLRLALMTGADIPVPECKLILHQPKMKEIAFIGESDFFTGVQTLCLNKRLFTQDESLLANTSNFQILMTIMSENETKDKRKAVEKVLMLLCPDYKVVFTPRSILLTNAEISAMLDEDNFEFFQEAIKNIFCVNTGPMDQHSFNPADKKAQEIAQKLMRGRQRVAAQNGESSVSSFSQYLSTLVVGVASMSLQDCIELTMFQLYDLIERYSLYTNWDIDIRSRLAGGKPDGQPENWMKNIH